jgi:hypothetical protein
MTKTDLKITFLSLGARWKAQFRKHVQGEQNLIYGVGQKFSLLIKFFDIAKLQI